MTEFLGFPSLYEGYTTEDRCELIEIGRPLNLEVTREVILGWRRYEMIPYKKRTKEYVIDFLIKACEDENNGIERIKYYPSLYEGYTYHDRQSLIDMGRGHEKLTSDFIWRRYDKKMIPYEERTKEYVFDYFRQLLDTEEERMSSDGTEEA